MRAVAKAEWGSKRTCPKCGTRFYDLGKDTPVACIDCAWEWTPEPILKSKQPVPEAPVKKEKAEAPAEDADAADDTEVSLDDAEDDVDIDLDDDLDDDGDVTAVVPGGSDGDES